jgi:hypothetical protein
MDATTTTTTTNLSQTRIPPRIIVCGDFNSLPKSAVHEYLVRGVVNAKQVAPWYCNPPGGQVYYEAKNNIFHLERINTMEVTDNPTTTATMTTTTTTDREGFGHGKSDDTDEEGFSAFESGCSSSNSSCNRSGSGSLDDGPDHDLAAQDTTTTDVTSTMKNLNLSSSADTKTMKTDVSTTPSAVTETMATIPPCPSPRPPPYGQDVRYLLDYTLNRFCRWLRILGFDATLETEEEEKLRTREGKPYVP